MFVGKAGRGSKGGREGGRWGGRDGRKGESEMDGWERVKGVEGACAVMGGQTTWSLEEAWSSVGDGTWAPATGRKKERVWRRDHYRGTGKQEMENHYWERNRYPCLQMEASLNSTFVHQVKSR